MKKSVKAFVLILLGVSVFLGVWAERAGAQGAKPAVVWPAEDIKWSDNPAIKGAKTAVLWGDPKVGAYGAIKKIAGGNVLALHTHTHDQKVITLAGTIVLTIEGGPHKELGPGSYAFVPGGMRHTAECKAPAECAYFEEQSGASDIKFVQAAPPKP